MPPPNRYPLPTLVALATLGVLVWQGGDWIRGIRAAVAARWTRAVEGPPVPDSKTPVVVAGPIIRRALLLRDETPVSSRPDSSPEGTIALRMFVDIYGTWPATGAVEYLRVGNRTPIGWVRAKDCLSWDTRLVLRTPEGELELADRPDAARGTVKVGLALLPITGWQGDWIEVAVWDRKRPWSVVERRGWVSLADLSRSRTGVLLAQEEIPTLIAQTIAAEDASSRDLVRLRAVLGRILDPIHWSMADVRIGRDALPERIFSRVTTGHPAERIASTNESNTDDAAWGGHAFRFVALEDLP
jgi:hypothetical protein